MEQKLKKKRKKYFDNYASEKYIQTGIPQVIQKRIDDSEEYIKKILKEDKKAMRKRIQEAKKNYKKNHGKEFDENEVIFV